MKTKLKVVVIVGPTSSGKTEMSLKLAKKFNGIIISADSRQIYKGLNIATAKTTKAQQAGIPHYMIDIAEPSEHFNVSLYQNTVYNLLHSIAQHNQKRKSLVIPFIVGGTGLYVQSVVEGYQIPKIEPNPQLRQELADLPLDKLVEKLVKLDPKTSTDLQNKRRIIRAIEIALHWKKQPRGKNKPAEFEFLQLGIKLPKEELHHRIEKKVDEMYQQGLVKETKSLLAEDYNLSQPAFSALGYRQIANYLKNKITLKKALGLMKSDIKKFAKRQMTWFKRDKSIHWITTITEAERLITKFLN